VTQRLIHILGVPLDLGGERRGVDMGPSAVRIAGLGERLAGIGCTVVDKGNLEAPIPETRTERDPHKKYVREIARVCQKLYQQTYASLDEGAIPIVLGGDHSIALPLLRAHAKKHGPVSLVHIDAHIDTWEAEFDLVPYSHGTPFRYALQEGLIRAGEYVQIGIRGPLSGENDYAEAAALGARTITIHEVMEKGVPEILKEVHQRMKGPVYVTVDIDSADPAFAPGTGTPEVGGLTSYQLLQLVRGLHGLDLIGFDLVEVSPPFDHGDITAILASNIVFEYLSLLAIKN